MGTSAALRDLGFDLRRLTWIVPEWPLIVLISCAWTAVAHHAGHRHPLGMGGWVVMVVAMMLPATLPITRAVSFGSMWHRRYRAPATFVTTYVAIWAAFGAVALAFWSIVSFDHAIDSATAAGAVLLVGAGWQLTAQHNRFLKRCHRRLPLGVRGFAADGSCMRYGAYHAWQCVGACWPLMLAMVPGHYLPMSMLAGGALSTWERLASRPRRRACAAVLAGLAALTALVGA